MTAQQAKTSNILDNWRWTDLCPTGISPFSSAGETNDLAPCFQEIFLQFPVLTIFAMFSSYFFGLSQFSVIRNNVQKRLLSIRILIVISLAFVQPIQFSIYKYTNAVVKIYPMDVLIACTRFITWIVHSGFLLSLRRCGHLSHRGPLFLNVILTSVFALDVVWLHTSLQLDDWQWSTATATVILETFYIFSLLPRGKSTFAPRTVANEDERHTLLGHRYVNLHSDFHDRFLGHAQDEANFLSKIFFYWVNPLIEKGLAGNLKKIEDLFDLPDSLNIYRLTEKIRLAMTTTTSLFWALHKTIGKEFYLIGILRLIADTAGFAGPLLLGGLLSQTDGKPYFYAMGLFIATLISAFCATHFSWRMSIVGMKIRTQVVSAIYRKSLKAKSVDSMSPDILNLMSTDADRIVNSCISFHSFWSIPFQLFTSLYLLYTQMGTAFIAGVLFAVALIPINRKIAMKIGKLSESLMKAKDLRISITNETLNGIKQIKLSAWEDIFLKRIQEIRKEEIKYLSKRKYLDALCVYFWATTPVLMCLCTFAVSVLTGRPLTASSTYTSVALLNMLIGPLNAFPWVLNGLVEAWVSLKRVQNLFNIDNIDYSSYYGENTNTDESQQSVVQITNATFAFSDDQSDTAFKLKDVNLNVKKGQLVCFEGPVGGGKSTLLNAIAAGSQCHDGTIFIQDIGAGFGYVSQSPWLQRGTVRENIVWGSVFDEKRYKNVIEACALNEDLQILGGDLIGVGEGGRTLSGGQRSRVALARAIYQDKNIYLLDDFLSALDAHVACHIIKYCILGLLKHKTRLVITEHRTLWYHSNQIIHVEDGLITPSQCTSESIDISDEDVNMLESNLTMDLNTDRDNVSLDSVMLEESKEHGSLSGNVIASYWKAMSTPMALLVILFVTLMQVSRNITDAWLAKWVTDTNVNRTNTNVSLIADEEISNRTIGYYLGIYTGLAVANSVITLIRAFVFAYAGIKAAKIIHEKLLSKVLYTKFHFFDVTSIGRILNRFSSDTYTIDDSLPFIFNIFLAQIVGLTGAIIICLYALPKLGLVIIPMCPIYINLQHRYRHASRDIKRLSSNALSPIYTQFSETLNGLTTIRAMRASKRFQRDFHVKLEESIKAQLSSASAQQWLALRLQMLGSVVVGGAGLLAAVTSAHATDPGLIGLSISYALSITGLLGGVLNSFAETEQEMIAVERVSQYLNLEAENHFDGTIDPPFGWPSQGVVRFENVSSRYRENLSEALRDVTFITSAFERIAIVGRTGAGKSSIFAALLRVTPLTDGNISVDCVNSRALALKVLRDRIVLIPQEPFLFEGTVRDNLDPREKYIDSEIWNAITNSLASPFVQTLGGLNGKLEKNGANISAGQRQLLCLARALLRKSKVVCIDEGTSNLDNDSEAAMHIVLKNAFRSSTVLFIAHRLKSTLSMDRIIVMDGGKIVEEGHPKELLDNPNSIFYSMFQEQ